MTFQEDRQARRQKDNSFTTANTCPSDGLLSQCNRSGITLFRYDLDLASEKDCKGTYSSTPAYDEAIANRPIKLSAETLFSAYEANEVAADDKYKDRKLLVTGTVTQISKGPFGGPILRLATSNQFMSVVCNDLSADQLAQLNKGDEVALICKGGGMTIGTPILRDCVFAP